MDSKFVIILGLLFNPVSIFLMGLVVDLIRCVFPTKDEKRAISIVNNKRNDMVDIPINYTYRDDKEELLREGISKAYQKRKENKQKIESLNAGLKKVSVFSKKDQIIKKRIEELESANKTMGENADAAASLANKMKQYRVLKNAKLGDVVTFGKYRWVVVKAEGNLRLLLCLFVISASYDRGGWAEGSLRYCCQTLYSEFGDMEKELMVIAKNKTKNENIITKDWLFVLSPEQLAGLPNAASILKVQWEDDAVYELNEYIYDYYEGYGGRLEKKLKDISYDKGWWLRASVSETAYIDPNGRFQNYSAAQGTEICGFRPAAWVSVD